MTTAMTTKTDGRIHRSFPFDKLRVRMTGDYRTMTSRLVAWRRKFKAAERTAHGCGIILKAVASTDRSSAGRI